MRDAAESCGEGFRLWAVLYRPTRALWSHGVRLQENLAMTVPREGVRLRTPVGRGPSVIVQVELPGCCPPKITGLRRRGFVNWDRDGTGAVLGTDLLGPLTGGPA